MSDEQLVHPPRMADEQLREMRRILAISSRFGDGGARTGTKERIDGGAASEGRGAWRRAEGRWRGGEQRDGGAAVEGWGAALVFSYGLGWQGFFCKKNETLSTF